VARVGEVRARVRGLSYATVREVAGRALDAESAGEVERLLDEAAHAGRQGG
jgi:phosphoenolpyruvate-protein kinase (PTS system EI component)